MYVCVCFGLSLRVHSGPADHAVRTNPGAGGFNRRSRGLPAVTLPILCTLATFTFWNSNVVLASQKSCVSPALSIPVPHPHSRSESPLLPILCTLATCLFFSQYLCHRWCVGLVASVHKMGTPSPAAVSARSAVIAASGAGFRARKTVSGGV